MVETIRLCYDYVRKLLILHRPGGGLAESYNKVSSLSQSVARQPVRAPFSITTAEPRNPLTSPSISPLERSYFGDFYWAWEHW